LSGLIVSSARSRRVAYCKIKPVGHVVHSDKKTSKLSKEGRKIEELKRARCTGAPEVKDSMQTAPTGRIGPGYSVQRYLKEVAI
jgi:hypothetical protein